MKRWARRLIERWNGYRNERQKRHNEYWARRTAAWLDEVGEFLERIVEGGPEDGPEKHGYDYRSSLDAKPVLLTPAWDSYDDPEDRIAELEGEVYELERQLEERAPGSRATCPYSLMGTGAECPQGGPEQERCWDCAVFKAHDAMGWVMLAADDAGLF